MAVGPNQLDDMPTELMLTRGPNRAYYSRAEFLGLATEALREIAATAVEGIELGVGPDHLPPEVRPWWKALSSAMSKAVGVLTAESMPGLWDPDDGPGFSMLSTRDLPNSEREVRIRLNDGRVGALIVPAAVDSADVIFAIWHHIQAGRMPEPQDGAPHRAGEEETDAAE
jgi:hypothetical protein